MTLKRNPITREPHPQLYTLSKGTQIVSGGRVFVITGNRRAVAQSGDRFLVECAPIKAVVEGEPSLWLHSDDRAQVHAQKT